MCLCVSSPFFVQPLPSHTEIYPCPFTTHNTPLLLQHCVVVRWGHCVKIISAPTAGSESHETAGLGSALLFICCLWASVQL